MAIQESIGSWLNLDGQCLTMMALKVLVVLRNFERQ
jgi:hypothetical protein